MGSSMEKDYFGLVRRRETETNVSVWDHNFKRIEKKFKTCKQCKESKEEDQFYRHPKDGLYSRCRVCDAERQRIYRAKRASKNTVGNTGDRPADPVHSPSVKPKKPAFWKHQSFSLSDAKRAR